VKVVCVEGNTTGGGATTELGNLSDNKSEKIAFMTMPLTEWLKIRKM